MIWITDDCDVNDDVKESLNVKGFQQLVYNEYLYRGQCSEQLSRAGIEV